MGECVKFEERRRIEKIKPFLFGDAFIYIAIALLIIALFLSFFFSSNKSAPQGFEVLISGKTVFTYDLKKDEFDINTDFSSSIAIEKEDDGYSVTVYTSPDKNEFNVVYISTTEKSARVIKSTCKKEYCTHTPSISSDGAIYCDPHQLKILPVGADGFTGSVIVG